MNYWLYYIIANRWVWGRCLSKPRKLQVSVKVTMTILWVQSPSTITLRTSVESFQVLTKTHPEGWKGWKQKVFDTRTSRQCMQNDLTSKGVLWKHWCLEKGRSPPHIRLATDAGYVVSCLTSPKLHLATFKPFSLVGDYLIKAAGHKSKGKWSLKTNALMCKKILPASTKTYIENVRESIHVDIGA